MSNVNIRRAIENIRANTTVYTPIVEIIVNAIQAIEESSRSDGEVVLRALRSTQAQLDGSLPDVIGFEIQDNGIGFTDDHRDSFDTLYTDHRISEGGKGFGRFTCLKYFENLDIDSVYRDGSGFRFRRFSMGKDHDIIINERLGKSDKNDCGTVVSLTSLKNKRTFDKKTSTVGRNLVERLLPFFITEGYVCPTIILSESDGSEEFRLDEFVNCEVSKFIREIPTDPNNFTLSAHGKDIEFVVRVFKIYAPGNQKSRISLVAHKREVSGTALHNYIPEFEEEFYDKDGYHEDDRTRNYIVKAYVFSNYLDENVSLERGGFEFAMETDIVHGISQVEIEKKAATIGRDALGSEISLRQEKKRERVQSYVDAEAPWHKEMLNKVDISQMRYNPTDEEIEMCLQSEKFAQERAVKRDVAELLSKSSFDNIESSVIDIVRKISGTSKNELIHYIALRRKILDIFGKSLEVDESGKYSSEGVVHDIVFPRKGDTEITSFHDHNLWILDERLNFTNYVSSDRALSGDNAGRPDLLVYNKRVLFRGDNEASNPITIFEFKKPQRDDFVNATSGEDPVQQIVRYVNNIRDGEYRTPKGRNIIVSGNTPFYGFVVCDLTQKVKKYLEREKDFTPMPDRLGWFQWMGNINLYVEVISWDKVLRDAQTRNRIFFEKLGI